jgi:hypothetical protein
MAINRPEIRLSDDNKEDLVKILERYAVEGAEYKGSWDQLHDEYWRQYMAEADDIGSDWPWPGANKFFAPMTQAAVDMLGSLFYDAMFSGRPRIIGSDELDTGTAEQLDRFYFEHVWKKVISLELLGNDWNFDTLIDGTSAVKIRWSRAESIVRQEIVGTRAITEKAEEELYGVPITTEVAVDYETEITELPSVVMDDRVFVETVDMGRLFVAPGTRSGVEPAGSLQWPNCRWYYEEMYWDRPRLEQARREGFEGLDDDDELASMLGEVDLTNRERSKHRTEHVPEHGGLGALVRIYFMRIALPGEVIHKDGSTTTQRFNDGIPEEVVVWFQPATQTIMRVMPLSRIRPDNKRPHVDNRYTRLGRFFFGQGIPAKLRQVNKLYNSATRQMIDYGTLQNLPWAFYEPATTGLLPNMQSLKPGALIPVANARGVNMPRFQGNHQFWLMVEQIAQQWMERLTNVTDFTTGRSPSLPNAPRTLGGQRQMLQQNNIAFSHRVSLFAVAYREIFRHVHMNYQRFAPSTGLEFRYFNERAGVFSRERISRDAFRADVDFAFELNPNKMLEQQKAQQLFSMVANIPYLMQDPEAMRSAMRDVYSSYDALDKFEKIWPEEKIRVQQQQMAAQQGGQPPQPMAPPMEPMGPTPVPGPPENPPENIPEESMEDLAVGL